MFLKRLILLLKSILPFGVKDIAVEYEWMPYFCSHCSTIGHSLSKCRKNKARKPTNLKQVWCPIPKDVVIEEPCTLKDIKLTYAEKEDFNKLPKEYKLLGFTIVKRSSSPKCIDVNTSYISNSNSFTAFTLLLDDISMNDDDFDTGINMMEGGRAPQTLPC